MSLPARLAELAEEPVRRAAALLHPRLPARALPGMDADVARAVSARGAVDPARLPVPVLRAGYRLQTTVWNRPRETAVRVTDEQVNDHLVVRTYAPHVERGGGMLYLHGGGMVVGGLDTHDRWCRWVAVRAGVVVHAVDYRLAPEHPHPAGVVDALVAWNHVVAGWRAQGRPIERLGVGGDSAGGYLAAVVATQAAAPTFGVPVAAHPGFAWLFYPAVDAVHREDAFDAFPSGVLLTGGMVRRFEQLGGGDGDPADPVRSPGLVDDEVLAGFPPTHLVTCEFDPLTPECLRLRDRLEAVGVAVTHEHLAHLPHEFISVTGVSDAAEQAAGRAIDVLGELAG